MIIAGKPIGAIRAVKFGHRIPKRTDRVRRRKVLGEAIEHIDIRFDRPHFVGEKSLNGADTDRGFLLYLLGGVSVRLVQGRRYDAPAYNAAACCECGRALPDHVLVGHLSWTWHVPQLYPLPLNEREAIGRYDDQFVTNVKQAVPSNL